ncbi:hypothetical protein [Herbidospora daliensis]|uniref:hypothetical protein n=1 Tax=Herbidospora daliensis TaxID=295585 RepID=UPI000785BBF9|nr:hypothetical protein [Herbidospora daliensis]
MDVFLRVLAEMAPAAGWAAALLATVVAAFVLYVGVAMAATLLSGDRETARVRYRVFADLLELFRRRPK